ncbi:hypothetical protein CEXT_19031 [Caerostris extrusa]|uniref:Uncharacterized protein n=1 Tax=Caerostris extrusa TaxID=172846 RepID=A0AAV4P6Z2_CAEEX|nr:hypothetical protein CEXT_19031 [Caerostris extrusa]
MLLRIRHHPSAAPAFYAHKAIKCSSGSTPFQQQGKTAFTKEMYCSSLPLDALRLNGIYDGSLSTAGCRGILGIFFFYFGGKTRACDIHLSVD